VLVADDEPAIQGLVSRIIHKLGLDVLLVGDGAAAIAAVEAQRDDLACAILDVVMPVMNGIDAAHTIQQIAPGLAIVLMSGMIPDYYAERISRLRLAGMLPKPFPTPALRAIICHAVDNDDAPKPAGAYAR
jgi:CheY-like chemotaxis protein